MLDTCDEDKLYNLQNKEMKLTIFLHMLHSKTTQEPEGKVVRR
jgi:hypothetical protein